MRKAQATLTDQELTIMKVVWRLGTPTVRDVYEALDGHRQRAEFTVSVDSHDRDTFGWCTDLVEHWGS